MRNGDLANFFMLFMYELRTYNRNGLNCAPKYEPVVHFAYQVRLVHTYSALTRQSFQIYMTVVLLVIPLLLMTALYGSVIKTLRSGIKMDIAAIEVESEWRRFALRLGNTLKPVQIATALRYQPAHEATAAAI